MDHFFLKKFPKNHYLDSLRNELYNSSEEKECKRRGVGSNARLGGLIPAVSEASERGGLITDQVTLAQPWLNPGQQLTDGHDLASADTRPTMRISWESSTMREGIPGPADRDHSSELADYRPIQYLLIAGRKQTIQGVLISTGTIFFSYLKNYFTYFQSVFLIILGVHTFLWFRIPNVPKKQNSDQMFNLVTKSISWLWETQSL